MNAKPVIAILVVLCLLLGGGLVYFYYQSVKQHETSEAKLLTYSNDLAQTSEKLTEQQKVNSALETQLGQWKTEAKQSSNALADLKVQYQQAQTEAATAAEEAEKEQQRLQRQIAELEGQREEVTQQMTDLKSSIDKLEDAINVTEQKLAAAEGDREFLLQELKRLQAEKAELERQFNDLAALRTQIRKLNEELSIANRLEWIRQGLFGQGEMRGADLLKQGLEAEQVPSDYGLNVELRRDGTAVIESETNAPEEETESPNEGPPVPDETTEAEPENQ